MDKFGRNLRENLNTGSLRCAFQKQVNKNIAWNSSYDRLKTSLFSSLFRSLVWENLISYLNEEAKPGGTAKT